jgi:TetR/AcrR family transcriptional regulator, mexCD-oprJ operon repressor
MPEPATDHRRAVSERNLEAILDAAERLLEQHKQPSIAAVAAESSVSRVTVYAHFATREALLEALVERAVGRATTGLDAARPDEGPAPEALERVIGASAHELGRHVAIAAAAAEHLDPGTLRRAHELSLMAVRRLIDRGRGDGSFRADLPAEWQVTCFYTLLHAAGEDIRDGRSRPADALDALTRSLRDLIVAG